jgi:hypothetical protein
MYYLQNLVLNSLELKRGCLGRNYKDLLAL